jgi:acetyl esterase/lipase
MKNVLRLLGGCLFMGLATLTVMPAPTHFLWKATVAATEWGYWIAIAAILPIVPTRNQTKFGKMGAVLSLGAIGLFLIPVVRASEMNRELPAAFNERFGFERRVRAHMAEAARPEPLIFPELLRPLELPAVRFEERVFSTHEDEKLTLDVYRPAYQHDPLPGLIVVHGGTWQSGSNAEFVALNAYLAGRDYVVAAINYRLSPPHQFPAGRDDVLAAIAYLKVYGHEFGMDPTRIALLGRSAGGQLALLAAYTAGEPAIRGVISIYGPTDLQFGFEHPAPPRLFDTREALTTYLGGAPADASDAYFAASPINFVSSSSPATLLIHGMRDGIVSPDESARLETKLQKAGVKHLFVRLPWATHGCDRSFGGPCGQIATYAVERFLDGVMVPPPAAEAPKKKGKGGTSVKRAAVEPDPDAAPTRGRSQAPSDKRTRRS